MRWLASFSWPPLLWALLSSSPSTPAYAGSMTIGHVSNGWISDEFVDLFGTTTHDILLDAYDGELILSQQILLRLTAGTIIQHPLGGLTPPDPELVSSYPALRFDSFVAGGSAVPTVPIHVPGTSSDLGHPGMSPAIETDTVLDVIWGAVPESRGERDYLSARFTLSDDAAGELRYMVSFGTTSSPIETESYFFSFCGGIVGVSDGSCGPVTVDDKSVEYTATFPSTIVSETLNLSNGGPFETLWSLESFDAPNGNPAMVDPDTGLFTWDGYGSPEGVYEAVIRFTGDSGSDTGTLSIIWHVSEPTAIGLLSIALPIIIVSRQRELSSNRPAAQPH